MDVILFSSCEEPQPSVQTLAGSKRHRATAAAVSTGSSLTGRSSMAGGGSKYGSMGGSRRKRHGPGMGAVAAVTAVSTAALAAGVAGSWLSCCVLLLVASLLLLCCARFSSSRSRFQSLWYKPVRAYVQGGYTISPREDCNAVNSPECLVTCILKVSGDMVVSCRVRSLLLAGGLSGACCLLLYFVCCTAHQQESAHTM